MKRDNKILGIFRYLSLSIVFVLALSRFKDMPGEYYKWKEYEAEEFERYKRAMSQQYNYRNKLHTK